MPFPPVHNVSFQEALHILMTNLALDIGRPVRSETKQAFEELFQMVDVVSTQLYNDVQRLKGLAKKHGWAIETNDPSQDPLP